MTQHTRGRFHYPLPQVKDAQLLLRDTTGTLLSTIPIDSAEWYGWLQDHTHQSFSYQTPTGAITLRREQQRRGSYWYAYQSQRGKVHKAYAGKSEHLSLERLQTVAATLLQSSAIPSHVDVGLHLFGSPHLLSHQQNVALHSTKMFALLTYLALHRRPQSREHLATLFWPDSMAAAARKNLRNLLWSMHSALGIGIIQGNEQVTLKKYVWTDVQEFEQVCQQVAMQARGKLSSGMNVPLAPTEAGAHVATLMSLYQGPLLQGIQLNDLLELDLWLGAERERLQQQYFQALSTLIHIQAAAGKWSEVLTIAHSVVALDPLQESMYHMLMKAYAYLGQRTNALRQYDLLKAALDRELGVAPLVETQQLRDAIVNGTLHSDSITSPHDVPQKSAQSASKVNPSPFIGRQLEYDLLQNALAEAARSPGQAHVVLINGEVGIGKSMLWQTWSSSLQPGYTAVELQCLASTQALPFAPLITFLRSQQTMQRITALLPRPPLWVSDVAGLVPDLQAIIPNAGIPTALSSRDELLRMFEAIAQSVLALSSQPLVLWVDDLHWADQTTLDWFNYFVQRQGDKPLLVVAAYRPEDAPPSLIQFTSQWARLGILQHLSLSPLTQDESTALVIALGGEQARSAAIYEQSAGNPYFISELVRSAPHSVPTALADLLQARLERLPEVALQVLQAAAILLPDTDIPTLRRTSGRTEEETLEALENLFRAGLLREQGQQYAFVHPLVATIIVDHMSGIRRAALHRRVAAVLESMYAEEIPTVAGRLFRHYQAVNMGRQAAHFAEIAATYALSLAAPAEAVFFYQEALALAPTPLRQFGLGVALIWQGKLEDAKAVLEVAQGAFDEQGNWQGVAQTSFELAKLCLAMGDSHGVLRWAEQGREALVSTDDAAMHAVAQYLLGLGCRVCGHALLEAETHLLEASQLAQTAQYLELRATISVELGNVYAQQGDPARAVKACEEAVRLAGRAKDRFQEILGHNNAAYYALLQGNLEWAQEHITIGLALAEKHAVAVPCQWLYSTQGELALAQKQWEEAATWFTRGLMEAEHYGNREQIANYHANLGLSAQGRGDLERAVLLLEQARTEATLIAAPHLHIQIHLWLTELYLLREEYAAAKEVLNRASKLLETSDLGLLRNCFQQLQTKLRSIL